MVAGCNNHDEEKEKQDYKKRKTEQANKSNNKIKIQKHLLKMCTQRTILKNTEMLKTL